MILFWLLYKKVSSKYHKIDRSIIKIAIEASLIAIKHHKIAIKTSQNRHKASCLKAKPPIRTKCPKITKRFGHSIPTVRATSAHYLVCRCPTLGPPSAHLTGTDRPLNGLWQTTLCAFIPNPACLSFLLFPVCIYILYILEK